MMNTMKKLLFLGLTLGLSLSTYSNGPTYASPKTKEVISKMIEAHGGYEKWSQLETLSFTSVMHSASLPTLHFWIKDQVVDMQTRRTYQDWPVVGSKLAFDGKKELGRIVAQTREATIKKLMDQALAAAQNS